MYYDRVPTIIEGNDLVAVRALKVESLEAGRRLLHVTFELRPDKEISTNTAELRLHVTDGATHALYSAEPYVEAAPAASEEAPVEEAPAASEEEAAPAVSKEEQEAIVEEVTKAVRNRARRPR